MLQDFILQQWREATRVNAYAGTITPVDAQQSRDFFQQLTALSSEQDVRTQLSQSDTERNRNVAWLLFDEVLKLDRTVQAERVQSLLGWTVLVAEFGNRLKYRDDGLEAHCGFYQGVLKHEVEDLKEAEQFYAQAETSYSDIGANPLMPGLAIYAQGVVALEVNDVEGQRALHSGAREQFQRAIDVLHRSTSQKVIDEIQGSINRLLNQWQLVNQLMQVDEPSSLLNTQRELLDHQFAHLLKRHIWNLAVKGQPVSEVLKAFHLVEVVASYLGQVAESTTRLDTQIGLDSLVDYYIYSRQYDAAEWLVQQQLKTHPGDLEFQKTLAEILSQQGKYAEARLLLEEALKLHPDNAFLHAFLGVMLFHLNDLPSVQTHSHRALELDPNVPFASDVLGQIKPRTLEPKAAVSFKDGNLIIGGDISALAPGELAAAMSAAVLAAHPEQIEGFFAEANPDLARRVVQLLQEQGLLSSSPQPTAEQYLEQAENFFAQARWKEAIEHYSLALENDPNLAKAYMGLGDAYYRVGQYYLALVYFEESIAIEPNQYTYRFLGDTYARIGKPKQAIEAYNQALKLDPNYLGAHQSLQQLLQGRERI